MNFIDEVKIYCKAGNGGNGAVSFRREKFIEFGGPDGGSGGQGGDIVFRATDNINTLLSFRYKQHFKASNGLQGMGKNRTGASGEDMIIDVPVGTQIYDEYGETLIADLDKVDSRYTLLVGGKGGAGNSCFKSSTNRAPRKAIAGTMGDEMWIWLKLKLLSDVGLVGLPNAGKSTFLSVISAATPKIADYPFTTLSPNLGMSSYHDHYFCVADIPGLIEGASQGLGLGDRFLKHIERCKILVHIIDISSESIADDIKIILGELAMFSPKLATKHMIFVLNKADIVDPDKAKSIVKELRKKYKNEFFICSAANNKGVTAVLKAIASYLYPTNS